MKNLPPDIINTLVRPFSRDLSECAVHTTLIIIALSAYRNVCHFLSLPSTDTGSSVPIVGQRCSKTGVIDIKRYKPHAVSSSLENFIDVYTRVQVYLGTKWRYDETGMTALLCFKKYE